MSPVLKEFIVRLVTNLGGVMCQILCFCVSVKGVGKFCQLRNNQSYALPTHVHWFPGTEQRDILLFK